MAGKTVDKFKYISQFYFVTAIFAMCDGSFLRKTIQSPIQTPSVTYKLHPVVTAIGEAHQKCQDLYRAQNVGAGNYENIPEASSASAMNCSYTANESFPLDLTPDGYLIVNVENHTMSYYPSSQFCISSRKSARLCQSQDTPTVWRKCCPEHQMLSEASPKTCVNSSFLFRLNVSGDSHSFIVKANSSTGSRMMPLTCPSGYHLKKLSTKGCRSWSMTRKVVAAISALFWNSDDDETSPLCNHCSFKLYSNGTISYEESTGVFIRNSQWKTFYPEEDHYCIDGITSHPTLDCNNYGQLEPDTFGCDDERREQRSRAILYICIQNEESFEETNDVSATAKTTLLAVIWTLSCPFLVTAALGNCLIIQRNVHGLVMTCYLFSMCLLNIVSVTFILNVGRRDEQHRNESDEDGGCHPIDFALKFTYICTLCWMSSVNFGLWKTFKYTMPEPAGVRRFVMSLIFSLGFPLISVTVSYYMARLWNDHNCKSEYCVLFSYYTIPFYQLPISLMVLGNLGIFLKTTCTIASLRKEAADILQIQAQDHLKSFVLFAKLFLLTGAIWLIRLVLFGLQIHNLYLSWYGVLLEMIFSLPEILFPLIVFHHPDFLKWSWDRAPGLSRLILKFNPFFKAVDSKKSVSI